MNDPFITLVADIVRNHGKDSLQKPNLYALLADYARGENKKEIRLFLRVLESDCPQKIALASRSSADLLSAALVDFLHNDYLIMEDAAVLMIASLFFALHNFIPPYLAALLAKARAPSFVQPSASILCGGFMRLADGTFTAGGGRGRYAVPQRTVRMDSFFIARHTVTQAEFAAVMGYNPSYVFGADLPVEGVSWYEAVEFCNTLSLAEGLIPAYTIDKSNEAKPADLIKWRYDPFNWIVSGDPFADGYRLPTQDEWEYACRAGTTTDYNTGDHATLPPHKACMDAARPCPVGSFPPNPWNLFDMHGNIAEWCGGQHRSPAFPYMHAVTRGGSYRDKANQMRSWQTSCPLPLFRTGSPRFIWRVDHMRGSHGGDLAMTLHPLEDYAGPCGIRLVKN
jgi:formylglycine-generating enzyme required for sulfatase activity